MKAKLLTAERFVDMRMGCSYRYVYSDTEYFRPHYHDYYEFFLLLDGQAEHCVNGARLPLAPGTLVFIRPNDTHDYLLRDGRKFSMLNITFTKQTAGEVLAYLGEGYRAERLLEAELPPQNRLDDTDFKALQLHMAEIRAIPSEDVQALKTAIRTLLFRLFAQFFSPVTPLMKSQAPDWLQALCAEMRRDGNFAYGISRLLSLTDKSREHVARSMKKYMGCTLSEFVNELRLNFIANMLQNSNHSIADIVFESGFGNLGWAMELFQRRFGMTMSSYRRSPRPSGV